MQPDLFTAASAKTVREIKVTSSPPHGLLFIDRIQKSTGIEIMDVSKSSPLVGKVFANDIVMRVNGKSVFGVEPEAFEKELKASLRQGAVLTVMSDQVTIAEPASTPVVAAVSVCPNRKLQAGTVAPTHTRHKNN